MVRLRLALAASVLAAVSLPAQSPESVETHLGHGYDALKQDRFEEAAAEFREALRLDPTLVMRAQFPLAVALFELKQSAEARREFDIVRRESGDQPAVAYYLGRLDLLDQQFPGAIRNLTQAAAKPPFPDTWYYLGLAYLKNKQLAPAEKWLKQAADANPRDPLAWFQLGMVYRKLGREAEAVAAMQKSSELRHRDTSESQLRTECGQKLDSGPRADARAVCQRLYDPDDADRLAMLGTVYGQHGDLEDALDPLRRAAELAPERPQMQYNLAYTYFRLGRYAEAREPVAKAVARWPDLFQLNQLYGAVLAKLGDDPEAYKALHRAHELNPRDAATKDLLYETTLRLARKSADAHRESDAQRYSAEAAALRN